MLYFDFQKSGPWLVEFYKSVIDSEKRSSVRLLTKWRLLLCVFRSVYGVFLDPSYNGLGYPFIRGDVVPVGRVKLPLHKLSITLIE